MIRPLSDDRLVLHVLYYADEVRAFDEVPEGQGATQRELQLATQLVHHLQSKTWNSSRYHDTYRERVLALIKQKQQNQTLVTPKAVPKRGKVLDLMTALKQSLGSEGRKAAPAAEGKKKVRVKSGKRSRKVA